MLESVSTGGQHRPPTHIMPDFNPMELLSIFENKRQIQVIERPPKSEISAYLQQVSARLGNGFRHILRPADAHPEALEQALRLPEASGKAALLAEISLLVNLYADLLDCPQVAIRLEVLQHALVLLKGSRWQGNGHAGVIHRSPEIAPGSTRVILALDAMW